MPFATSLSFLLLGGSLLLLDTGRAHLLAQLMTIVVILLSLLAVTGFAYRVISPEVGAEPQLAFHTIVLFLSLACGLLAFHADQGVVKVILSDDMGGVLARRLLPVAVSMPIVLGWLHVEGRLAGLYGTEVGAALFAIANVACFTTVALWAAQHGSTERIRIANWPRSRCGRARGDFMPYSKA